MGRKPLPLNLKRGIRTQVMITPDERDELQEAVDLGGYASISDFMRDGALKLARRIASRNQ
jgi:Arc/MetJ-type ribon-helix-helix transcriptional regulator